MKSSIYISSGKIEVVGYDRLGKHIAVRDYLAEELPEGVMINGKITDYAQLVECLSAMRAGKKRLFAAPTLVIDGAFIFAKRMAAPKLSRARYHDFVRMEFAESAEVPRGLICGYQESDTSAGGRNAIWACACDKSQVESYVSAFKDAGIKLKAMRIGMQATINYVSLKPELQSSTFILNMIDGVTMLSMIFDKGVNVFTSRTRLYTEDYEQYMRDILENLSRLIQFNKSEKFNDIETSYYLGLSAQDLKAISGSSEVKLRILDITRDVQGAELISADSHFPFLGALLSDGSIDFIESYKYSAALERRQRPKNWRLPVIAVLILLLAASIAYLYMQIAGLDRRIDEVNAYLNDEAVTSKSEEIDGIIEQAARYSAVSGELEARTEYTGRIDISNELLDLITQADDKVSVGSFDYNENSQTIRVSAHSETEMDSARYVEKLKQSELVEYVGYTGYSYSGGGYNFSIEIQLPAGEEAAQ